MVIVWPSCRERFTQYISWKRYHKETLNKNPDRDNENKKLRHYSADFCNFMTDLSLYFCYKICEILLQYSFSIYFHPNSFPFLICFSSTRCFSYFLSSDFNHSTFFTEISLLVPIFFHSPYIPICNWVYSLPSLLS